MSEKNRFSVHDAFRKFTSEIHCSYLEDIDGKNAELFLPEKPKFEKNSTRIKEIINEKEHGLTPVARLT